MFQKARIKLTTWYLLIIMSVSIIFSLAIYSGINGELGRFEKSRQLRLQREQELIMPAPLPPELRNFDIQNVDAARMRLTLTLIFINAGIFVIAGFAGYFLAGRTLDPIKEMMDEQNRFITDASHELRTPLTSLKTSIEVNLRNKNLTIDQAKKLIESNLEDVEHLRVLTDGLIRLTYYQKPNGNTIFEKISLKEIVDSAVDKVKAMARENKIKIDLKIGKINLTGNRKSLTELLVILLDNAIKYNKQNSLVKVFASKKDGRIIITVSDQGIGIDNQDLPHIFDRFYRAEKSRSKKDVSGYGLGLSIAKKIVEIHNGTITVRSEKGKGTTFAVML
jgi:two-component system, OmpR family, sensor histidine kinase CiaH